jgi:NAD+ diphosphatase
MSRESIYKRYIPSVTPKHGKDVQGYWFIFNQDNLLINCQKQCKIPFINDLTDVNISPIRTQYFGTLNGNPCYCAELLPGIDIPEEMDFFDLYSSYDMLDEDIFLIAGRAIQIVNWDKNHQFCGKCGSRTKNLENELAKICKECEFISYPRISPAVIIAITKKDKILMAKHSYGLKNRYVLIAGFVEAGETLEECVKREIMEEVGLKVSNITYFGSQSWPFPNSLMIGYTAEYESGEIDVDGKEIVDAQWFDVNSLTPMPSKMSISSELIEWYLDKFSHK